MWRIDSMKRPDRSMPIPVRDLPELGQLGLKRGVQFRFFRRQEDPYQLLKHCASYLMMPWPIATLRLASPTAPTQRPIPPT
jgi:hypothetical protein